jgi:PAS domain S-box-containing protein
MTGDVVITGHADEPRGVDSLEQRLQLLVDSVVDYAIYLLSPQGVIQSWNTGAQRLKGYTADEVLGRHYSIFYPQQDREDGLPQRLLDEARARGSAAHSGWRVRKDGTQFWADVVITALRGADGALAGFAKVTRDMTESHQAEEARQRALADQQRALETLAELDRWRREFISSVVHDVKNPVIAITAFAALALEELPTDAPSREFVERILSNAHSLDALVDHLRTFAQLESGQVDLEPEPIALQGFVDDLLADMEPVVAGHPVHTDLDGAEVLADRRGLERILRNLVSNAARHTPPGRSIVIRATRGPDLVTVEVADDGDGIPEQLLPRLFERFERGRHGGTGLGLAIVKQFVELHGGEVSAASSPGEGSTLRFTLPRDARPSGPDASARP